MSEPASLIGELRALADAATEGPWVAHDPPYVDAPAGTLIYDEGGHSEADAVFIARSRSAIPELCDALESALRERDEARAEAGRLGNALAGIVDEENTVGHAHERPGIWDDDNGALAGKPCHRCAAFAEARAALGDSQ